LVSALESATYELVSHVAFHLTRAPTPWGKGETIELPRLDAEYDWDCKKLFRLTVTLELEEQGYTHYALGDGDYKLKLPKRGSLIIDKSSATEAGSYTIMVSAYFCTRSRFLIQDLRPKILTNENLTQDST